ncbi:MAG: 2,3-bisphosphoglycerate-independent phosphoglycerate mutase [Sedimenticola sp.]
MQKEGRLKGLFIILDGVGDRPSPELDGETPLERADTPNLDRLVSRGLGGMMDPLFPGVAVGTHVGTAILFGLPPAQARRLTRGPVEAAGIELEPAPGDLLMRANLATVEPDGEGFVVRDRRAGRIEVGAEELAASLSDIDLGGGVTGRLHPATQHRMVLQLSGGAFSADISDTDPGGGAPRGRVLTSRAQDLSDALACATAEAVNGFTRIACERLADHPVNRQRIDMGLPPANGVICRSAGLMDSMVSLFNRFGVRAAVIAGESTVLGLGRLLGYAVHTDARFNSLPTTDLEAKVEAASRLLEDHDLVFLHIKGPDICSHDHDPVGKARLLERVDAALAPLLPGDMVIAVTGDHSTDCGSGRHTGDPVPTILFSPAGRRDGVDRYGETSCFSGGLGRLSGTSLVASVLDAMGFSDSFKPDHESLYF